MPGGGGSGTGMKGGHGYRFDAIAVDPLAHTLTRDGHVQAVEPKAFAVLLHLLERPGELVRHGELLDAVWGHRHVTPGVLTRAIAQLRHALADDSQRPRYIETQHGLGYRFIAQLQPDATMLTAPATEALPHTDAEPGQANAYAVPAAGLNGDNDRAAIEHAPVVGPAGTDSAVSDSAVALPPVRRTGQPRLWIFAVLAGLAVLVAVAWYRQRLPFAGGPDEASIAVLPFTSLSPDEDDDYFAEGLAVEMHDALAGVPGLKVAACRVDSICGTRGADARKIGKLLGVAAVLDADVRREGQRVRINARLSNTRTGFTLWSGSYDRQITGVFALQSEIARDVVQSLLGVLPRDPQSLSRRLAPTRSIAAYDAYLRGVQHLQYEQSGGNGRNSIGFFQEALASDPGFSRAQAGICRAEIIRFEGEHDAAAFERAQAACERAAKMDPHLREVSLALGDLHRARGDNAQAIEHYRKALESPALRADAYLGLGRAEAAQWRNQVALGYFERARELRPGDPATYSALGYQYYRQGNLSKAIEEYQTAATLAPDDERIWGSLGGLYMIRGDTAQAADAFTRSLAIKPDYSALINLGTLRYEAGRYGEAAALYRRAAQLEADDYRVWGNLADALSALPASAAQAREPYQRAAQMAQQYVDIKPGDAHALGVLAWYRANLGQHQAARVLIQRAEALGTEKGEVAFWAAQSLALLGDTAGARQRLERARAAGIPLHRLEASPVLRPLLVKHKGEGQSKAGPAR